MSLSNARPEDNEKNYNKTQDDFTPGQSQETCLKGHQVGCGFLPSESYSAGRGKGTHLKDIL